MHVYGKGHGSAAARARPLVSLVRWGEYCSVMYFRSHASLTYTVFNSLCMQVSVYSGVANPFQASIYKCL